MSSEQQVAFDHEEPLLYHEYPTPGKYTIKSTKPMNNQHDLSMAYSPGVAVPCMEIHKNPANAFKYTGKGNMVAVISNGTAVLGLGNIGALASKPVMEGKSVLFSKFAGVEAIDAEIRIGAGILGGGDVADFGAVGHPAGRMGFEV